jgi:hypothetical protein
VVAPPLSRSVREGGCHSSTNLSLISSWILALQPIYREPVRCVVFSRLYLHRILNAFARLSPSRVTQVTDKSALRE